MKKIFNIMLALLLVFIPITSNAKGVGQAIIGPPTTTVEKMKDWARSKGAHEEFIRQAQTFYDVSVRYGIDPAVTYAQSAKETNYFKFTGVLTIDYKNPCGMKTSSGGGDYDKTAHQKFSTWEEGITAQVHHLALYAGHKDFPKADSPDPRHFPFIYNTVSCVEELGGKWAPSKTYGSEIVNMMRAFADVNSTYDLTGEPEEPVKEPEVITPPTSNIDDPEDLRPLQRVFGENRNLTSIQISKKVDNNSIKKVILAPQGDFPNALLASSITREENGYSPIILVGREANDETIAAIDRINPEEVCIVASDAEISYNFGTLLKSKGYTITRFSGRNRFETANKIADLNGGNNYILVNSSSYADAISISSYAARQGISILFTDGKTLDLATNKKIMNASSVMIIGGTNSVSSQLENEIAKRTSVRRIEGKNRYETSVNIAKELFPESNTLVVANGEDFPDSLAGAPLAAYRNAPIILSSPTTLTQELSDYLNNNISYVVVLGGSSSVSQDVYKNIMNRL